MSPVAIFNVALAGIMLLGVLVIPGLAEHSSRRYEKRHHPDGRRRKTQKQVDAEAKKVHREYMRERR